MDRRRAVTCFLERDGKVLILKRSERVGSYRGKWGAVAGYVEEWETPDETARKEIREETGITDAELVCRGEPYEFQDPELGVTWVIHPYRFATRSERIRLDWEHVEARWVSPEELERYDTVPHLVESWRRVSGSRQGDVK